MIDVEKEQRYLALMPLGVGELDDQTVVEVLAVQGSGQAVDDAELVALLERENFLLVRQGESEKDRSKPEAIAVGELRPRDRLTTDRRAVARAEILDEVFRFAFAYDARVTAADAGVVDVDLAVRGTPHHRRSPEPEDRTGLRAVDHRQCASVAHRCRTETSRTGGFGQGLGHLIVQEARDLDRLGGAETGGARRILHQRKDDRPLAALFSAVIHRCRCGAQRGPWPGEQRARVRI